MAAGWRRIVRVEKTRTSSRRALSVSVVKVSISTTVSGRDVQTYRLREMEVVDSKCPHTMLLTSSVSAKVNQHSEKRTLLASRLYS